MAYFECIIGSRVGFSIPLVVTCTANFAGQTITCSDGTTTLTGTCPSASPYEVTFELPNTGTWTVSGTISGQTYSDSILVNEFDVELVDIIDITVDVYSAASDTVSYVGVDGQTHTITTDSTGYASATITINFQGSSLTFESSVAKDPSNLSNNYTKTIALTSATTSIYVMLDKALYWYGNELKTITVTDYRSSSQSTTTRYNPQFTKNTNNLYLNWNSTRDGNRRCGTLYFENTSGQSATKVKALVESSSISLDNNNLAAIIICKPATKEDLWTWIGGSDQSNYIVYKSSSTIYSYSVPTIIDFDYDTNNYVAIYYRISDTTGSMEGTVSAIWLE